jgi:hypothetical protein
MKASEIGKDSSETINHMTNDNDDSVLLYFSKGIAAGAPSNECIKFYKSSTIGRANQCFTKTHL